MRSVVAPSLLRELAAGAQGDVQGWLVDAMRHWRAFGGREGAPPPRFDSLRQLRDHAAVARAAAEWRRNAVERRRRIREAYRRSSFPEGNADIVRLRTARDLDEEGAVQRNCVASYWRRARADALAVYRVLRPERATLSVRRGELGYEIGELEAAHCRPVRPETRAAVDAWLAESLADLYRRATA